MRVVKEAAERKNEILDAAMELFGQKGFDGTSTGDILEKVGIARGTLYYHFKCKEDIMDALIERLGSRMLSAAEEIAKNKKLSVLDRIVGVVMSMNIRNGNDSEKEMLAHMHTPQNALMHQKTKKFILSQVTPILAEIAREGIEQGLINTPFPYECTEMIISYVNTVFDDDETRGMQEADRAARIEAFIFNIERLLGAQSGSFSCAMMRVFEGGD